MKPPTRFHSHFECHGMPWPELEVFGGLRKGEKFTMDKAVILRTEVGNDQGVGSRVRKCTKLLSSYWAAIKLLRLLRLCMFLLDYLGSGVCHSDIGHKLTCTHLQTPSPFVPHKSRDRYNMCINILQDSIAINYHYTIYMHSYICRIVYIDIHTNSLYIDAYVLALSLLCSKY
jgi:hypothetical protein